MSALLEASFRSMKKLSLILSILVGARLLAVEDAAKDLAEQYLTLPPSWAGRVVYYHGFEKSPGEAEMNLKGVKIACTSKDMADDGFFGKALKCDPKQPYRIAGEALSASKPLTLLAWWRLDEEMKDESCFHLITLCGRGHIASFVRGKGEWCGLREPTYISQIHGFTDIPNHNNPWGGRAVFPKGEWHHCAISVGNANEVKIYWDGKLRETITAKGRRFAPDDTSVAEFGSNWLGHPMSIDEVVITDRVLSEDEIANYVKAMESLSWLMKSGNISTVRISRCQ